jgi:hypothetical protein
MVTAEAWKIGSENYYDDKAQTQIQTCVRPTELQHWSRPGKLLLFVHTHWNSMRPCRPCHGSGGTVTGLLQKKRPEFAPGSVHVELAVDRMALGQHFLRVLRFPLSESFHRGSTYSYTCIWSGGWTTGELEAAVQRQTHPIDMSNNMKRCHYCWLQWGRELNVRYWRCHISKWLRTEMFGINDLEKCG